MSQQQTSGNVLVVSPGAVLRFLLHVIKGQSLPWYRNGNISPNIFNTTLSLVCYRQACLDSPGKFTMKKYNDIKHL